MSLTIAVASSSEAVSIGTLLTNSYRQLICGCCMFRAELLADQVFFVSGFYYMVGLCLCDTLSVSEDDVASGVQGVVPLPIGFGINSCIFYKDHHFGI